MCKYNSVILVLSPINDRYIQFIRIGLSIVVNYVAYHPASIAAYRTNG